MKKGSEGLPVTIICPNCGQKKHADWGQINEKGYKESCGNCGRDWSPGNDSVRQNESPDDGDNIVG